MGLSEKAMSQRFDGIVQFAELEQFIDTPVRHYSSGMYIRLGFSVALSLDADILLIDEVLAVGDRHFQEKCLNAIEALQRQGVTLLLVSHDLDLIQRYCSRALLLSHGSTAAYGPTADVIAHYTEAMVG